MIKFLNDIKIDKSYLQQFWQTYSEQKRIEICDLVKNVYLMHCFTHKARQHVAEDMYSDNDTYDYFCDQCKDFTHYSSIMLVDDKYKDICLSTACLKEQIKEYIEQQSGPQPLIEEIENDSDEEIKEDMDTN